jgi:glycine/D-amino acid oxidase-like deaminating enzyme
VLDLAAGAMRHTRHGWWLEEAGAVAPFAPLTADISADVVVIGGGYAGLWTAWQVLERAPQATVAVLEADVCGHGPSGRNGGFCQTLWADLPALCERLGETAALALCRASSASVQAIGDWCRDEGVDAWFHRAGTLIASAAPAQDDVGREAVAQAQRLGEAERLHALAPPEVAARCAAPVLRGGVLVADDATVQPARLALGLRRLVAERGALVFEGSRVRRLRVEGPRSVVAETAGGRVRASAAVLAVNAAARGVRPLRARLSVTSSHIVLTEPVPDVLEQVGWTGGEAITDGRTFVHYLRTTPDGRIAFGWGGGQLAWGARLGGRVEVDPNVAAQTREHLLRMFPALAGRRITHAWGGPIDVSPGHLPQIGSLPDGPVHYAFGYTGNGVGPCHLAGRVLASLALDARDADSRLPLVDRDALRVPPEPLAWAAGTLVRAAWLRKERLEEAGRRPDLATRVICAAPRAVGLHLAR